MSNKLPDYNPTAKCPKCEHDDVTARYCTGGHYGPCEARHDGHLDRTCCRCGYKWYERTLDANHD